MPANPSRYIDASDVQLYPKFAKVLTSLAADQDLSTYFTSQGFARKIYVGSAGALNVTHVGDTTSVTYIGLSAGTWLSGCFVTIGSSTHGTTITPASNIIVEE